MARPAWDGPTPRVRRGRGGGIGQRALVQPRAALIMTMIVSKVTSHCESVGFTAASMPKVRRIATQKPSSAVKEGQNCGEPEGLERLDS